MVVGTYRCDCGNYRCATTVSRRTWFRHRMAQVLDDQLAAGVADDDTPLPVEGAPPPDEIPEQHDIPQAQGSPEVNNS